MKFLSPFTTRGMDEAGTVVNRLGALPKNLWRAGETIAADTGRRMEQAVLASQASRALRGLERSFAVPGLHRRLEIAAAERRFSETATDPTQDVQRIVASLRDDA